MRSPLAAAATAAVRLSARRRRRLPGFVERESSLNAFGLAVTRSSERAIPQADLGQLRPASGREPAPRKLLLLVQRYGVEVAGGAEALCRQLAARLATRGHDVHVATSCALDANTWEPFYAPGETAEDGVTVHRFGPGDRRDPFAWEQLSRQVLADPGGSDLERQGRWLRQQGPHLPGLIPWLREQAGGFDLAMHFSYLFSTTWEALPLTAAAVPTVLHATAHDEPAFWLPVYDPVLALPTAYAWLTPEEEHLVSRRLGGHPPGMVVGAGADLDALPADRDGFRRRCGVGDRPYLLFVGRVEAGKGALELAEFFIEHKRRRPGELQLVFVGPAPNEADRPRHPEIHYTGFVDEAVRTAAVAGCLALVQPSYFESFSMVLIEAWAQRRPALVQGLSDVLVGQVARAGGGLAYRGFAEFDAAVDALLRWPRLAGALGRSGRRYAEVAFSWPAVLDRYEQLIDRASSTFLETALSVPSG